VEEEEDSVMHNVPLFVVFFNCRFTGVFDLIFEEDRVETKCQENQATIECY